VVFRWYRHVFILLQKLRTHRKTHSRSSVAEPYYHPFLKNTPQCCPQRYTHGLQTVIYLHIFPPTFCRYVLVSAPRKPSWCCHEKFRLLITIITEWHLKSRGFTLFQQSMEVPTFFRYIQDLKISGFRRLATPDKPAVCKRTVQSTAQNNLSAISRGNFSDTLVRRVSILCRFSRNHTENIWYCSEIWGLHNIVCRWGLGSAVMWRRVSEFVVTEVSRKRGSFGTSESNDPVTQHSSSTPELYLRFSWLISPRLTKHYNRTFQCLNQLTRNKGAVQLRSSCQS